MVLNLYTVHDYIELLVNGLKIFIIEIRYKCDKNVTKIHKCDKNLIGDIKKENIIKKLFFVLFLI